MTNGLDPGPARSESARPAKNQRFSVIITTFNRVHVLSRAVNSVLSQQGPDVELIVVDDGSTDETPSLLAGPTDPRIVVERRPNGGLSAARNTGIARASGDWTVFLDDDDVALPGWLEGFASLADDHAGVVCCGAEFCTDDGVVVQTATPRPMGPLFERQTGHVIAGTFAARTDLLRAIGGFDERLTCSHQTELAMRLMPAMLDRGLCIRSTDRLLVRIARRAPKDRPMSSPAALFQGTQILLDRHRDKVAQDPHGRAVLNSVLGVSAVRLEKWRHARSAFLTSARAEPRQARHWFRLATACCPPIARRVWRVSENQREVLA
jgi:glycosyltransferase involved in cell wall biosynthesis